MAVTIKKIAQALNISVSTVSMALHNHPGISEETKKKVSAEAGRMGYTKHLKTTAAEHPLYLQLLIYKKHGDVVADTHFFSSLFQGVESQVKKRGHNLLISYFYENQDLQEQLRSIMSSNSKGIILVATEMFQSDLKCFSGIPIPIVVLDSYFPQSAYDCVGINNVQGACAAVRYLIECGHTEIGYLSSKISARNFYERAEGYRKGVRSIQVENGSRNRVVKLAPTAEGALYDMQQYLSQCKSLPTAFFADNDIIASSAIRALKEHGCRIPQDISVIGFDDILTCELIDPPLTTIRVWKESLGKLAVNRLLERIDGNAGEILRIQVTTGVIERRSVLKRRGSGE